MLTNNGFVQGVTYDELSSVGALLQKENLEQTQKEKAVTIVQKLQGNELFSLLKNSIEDASRKIAEIFWIAKTVRDWEYSLDLKKNGLFVKVKSNEISEKFIFKWEVKNAANDTLSGLFSAQLSTYFFNVCHIYFCNFGSLLICKPV